MNFAIMRAKKLSGMGSVAASLQHCFRERETLNANEDLTNLNEHRFAHSTAEAMSKLRSVLPEKRRKDAVLVVEYVMTASPEWFWSASREQQNEFFERSIDWLSEKYGRDNIVVSTVHRDELTPHLSAFVVPRKADGKLSAKHFIGNRTKMSDDQTSFAKAVESLGLQRGIKGSQATHQRVKSHYGALKRTDSIKIEITPEALEPEILEKNFFTTVKESNAGVAARITKSVNEKVQYVAEKASKSVENERRAKRQARLASERQTRLGELEGLLVGIYKLSREQLTELIEIGKMMIRENKRTAELKKALTKSRRRGRGT